MSDEQRREIIEAWNNGATQAALARKYGKSQGTISGVITGNTSKKKRA